MVPGSEAVVLELSRTAVRVSYRGVRCAYKASVGKTTLKTKDRKQKIKIHGSSQSVIEEIRDKITIDNMKQSTVTFRTISLAVLCMVLFTSFSWAGVIKNRSTRGGVKPGYPLEKMDPVDACLFICNACYEVSQYISFLNIFISFTEMHIFGLKTTYCERFL